MWPMTPAPEPMVCRLSPLEEQDSNHRSPRKGPFFRDATGLATTNQPGSQSRILAIDKGRFTVRRARLAPAMISYQRRVSGLPEGANAGSCQPGREMLSPCRTPI